MYSVTRIVKHLLILNVLFYLGSRSLLPQSYSTLALYYPASDYFRPYQLVTHMFMHGDLNHLIFNMLTLFFLGPMVEQVWREKKFLFYYLACGIGAMLFHMLEWYIEYSQLSTGVFSSIMSDPRYYVLGASGAVMGILAAFAMLFPDRRLMLLFPPIPIKAKYLAVGLIAIDLFLGFSGRRTGVAHFAHVGGAVTGLLIMLYWRRQGKLTQPEL